MKTFMPTTDTRGREWVHIDAEGKTLGRLASAVADILRGKNKPTFTPHLDCGDFVIITNDAQYGKLNIYNTPDHPHVSQKPRTLELSDKGELLSGN